MIPDNQSSLDAATKPPAEVGMLKALGAINFCAALLGSVLYFGQASRLSRPGEEPFDQVVGIGLLIEAVVGSAFLFALAAIIQILAKIEKAVKQRERVASIE